MSTQLPAVITRSDEYETLTDVERNAFLQRLRDAFALGSELADDSRMASYPDFFQFTEDLELDVSRLQEFDLPWGGTLSRWQLHYSWTFHTSPGQMRDALTSPLIALINAQEPSTESSLDNTAQWLKDLGEGLTTSAINVSNAIEYGSAMAHLIAIDILLGKVASACFKLRLNRLVQR